MHNASEECCVGNMNYNTLLCNVVQVWSLPTDLLTMVVPAWTLLKSKDEAVKVVVAVWGEQDVQDVPGAFYWLRQLIPAKPSDHRGVQTVAVSQLHIVVTTAVVCLQAEQWKPAAGTREKFCRNWLFNPIQKIQHQSSRCRRSYGCTMMWTDAGLSALLSLSLAQTVKTLDLFSHFLKNVFNHLKPT